MYIRTYIQTYINNKNIHTYIHTHIYSIKFNEDNVKVKIISRRK